MKKLINKIQKAINAKVRKVLLSKQKTEFKGNEGRTVICNNCTGAMMLNDLGYRFDTPTVNLCLNVEDYVLMVKHLPDILHEEIVDVTTASSNYPIGLLAGKVKLHFMHYKSFDDAVLSWKRRTLRVDMDNLYLVCVDTGDDGKKLDLEEFSKLPCKKKIAFTREKNDMYPFVYKIDGFENEKIMRITDYSGWLGKRYYDQFNFKSFFE